MARSDELMKGFQIGYQNAPFSALGNAIKGTLGRLTEREDMTTQFATKAGIDQMFQDPLDREYKQSLIDTSTKNAASLSQYRKEMAQTARFKARTAAQRDSLLDRQKNKDITNLQTKIAANDFTRKSIGSALESLNNIPSGFAGNLKVGYMKNLDPNNPVLSDWQNVKSVLSDIQLGNLQFTKGAISDAEMKFFATAVANDDLTSIPRIKTILNRALQRMESEETGLKQAFELNYNNPFTKPNESSNELTDEQIMNIINQD